MSSPGLKMIYNKESASQLVWAVCADILCLVFTRHGDVHYGQTSQLWSHLTKGHCSRGLVVCSDATCSSVLFKQKKLYLCNHSKVTETDKVTQKWMFQWLDGSIAIFLSWNSVLMQNRWNPEKSLPLKRLHHNPELKSKTVCLIYFPQINQGLDSTSKSLLTTLRGKNEQVYALGCIGSYWN